MDETTEKRSKKKRRVVDSWKKNKTKKMRNSGEEYVSLVNKKTVTKKMPPADVKCKCPLACRSIRLEYLVELYNHFYEMADYSKQQSYLQRFIHPQLIKRRRHGQYEHPSESRRKHSFTYHLLLPGGSEIRVCLKTFCSTFAVTPRRVQLLGEKILDGKMDMSEKRGGARQNIFKTVWTNKIIEHIESFPKIESHYAKTPDKLFLSPDLNVSRMYRAFLEKYCADYQPPNKPPVTRQWYNEIFISKFNLSFARPKVDTCSTCDSLAVQIKSGDKAAVTEQELHHRRGLLQKQCQLRPKMHVQVIAMFFPSICSSKCTFPN
ncbi:uncharacterized protein [Diabrotica undecimpunctata]|uniref:uncharacterized protein isoform X1 n=1 Tax=Diabrotica undecimpunctata TaxID=50387 RepID=UPI003B63C858